MKKAVSFFLALAMLVLHAAAIDLYVDGKKLAPEVPPLLVEGNTLVPLRAIFEALHAQVTWDASTATAKASKEDITVVITAGAQTAQLSGKPVALPVPAKLVSGRMMVPVRFVAEALQADVEWKAASKAVYVYTVPYYQGHIQTPEPVYATPAERNGLSGVMMYADGTVTALETINGFETCTLETQQGSLTILKVQKEAGWETLKIGQPFRILYQYQGYSEAKKTAIGMFLELGDLSVAPTRPGAEATMQDQLTGET